MLLQRLREYASARTDDLGPPMYIETPIRYEVALDREGNSLGLTTLSGAEGRRQDRGKVFFAPSLVRSSGIKSKLLVDNGEYALGWVRPDKDPARVARQHEAFVELVNECAADTQEADIIAVLQFLRQPVESRLDQPDDFDANQNVTFSVDDRFPFELPSVRRFWASHTGATSDDNAGDAQCLVCGTYGPVVRLLPQKIKGIPDGQSSGTALVSTNVDSFRSYGLDDISCAPICAECAELACKGLNNLLATETSRVDASPLVYTFWTAEDIGFNPRTLLSQPDAQQVGALIASVKSGRQGAVQIDPTAFYCVGLAGSGGRVAVRDWVDTSVERVQQALARYFELQRLYNPFDQEQRYFSVSRLARTTLRSGAKMNEDPAPSVPRALIRTALIGTPLPSSLLSQVVKRVRAEQAVSHERATLIKMVLASQDAQGRESTLVGLDEGNKDPAYLCGRLLAVLDSIQRAALGTRNATIIDRFFGTASSAPVSVFGRLVRGAQPHLAKLRRDRPGTYHALENRMQEIISQLNGFPRTLTLHEQGLFILGYYHQRAADTKARIERGAANRAAQDTELDTVEQEG